MKNKITIGCANIGDKYGIKSNKVHKDEIDKIFNFCNKNKIIYFDTADNYKNSYQILSQNNYNVIIDTKIVINEKWNDYKFCLKHLLKIKKKIRNKKIDTIYIHNPAYLSNKNSKNIIKNLQLLKKNDFFNKIGLSIYSFDNIYENIKEFKFDVIQCPFNIFDQRLIKEKHLYNFKKKGIGVHVRSVFLQGLLINQNFKKTKKFKKWKNEFDEYFGFLNKKRLKAIDLCLNFVLGFKKIDKIIVGINSKKHLNDICKYKKHKFNKYNLFDHSDKKNLIDPRRW